MFLAGPKACYNLLVTHVTGASYIINLASCHAALSDIHRPFRLKDLFATEGLNKLPSAWLNMVTDHDQERTDVVRNTS